MGFSGEVPRRFWRVMHACILLLFCFSSFSCSAFPSDSKPEPTATPVPENNPIQIVPKEYVTQAGNVTLADINIEKNKTALVRVIGTTYADDLDQDKLSLPECLSGQVIAVWISGYYTETITCDGTTPRSYEVPLDKIDTSANTSYPWISARSCSSTCHDLGNEKSNEYNEWNKSNHAKGFFNRYFETMYLGTFFNGGGTSPLTNRDVLNDDLLQRAPNDQNYHGPGYRIDYPNSNGNCAFCHAPVAVAKEQVEVNPFPSSGIIHEGVTCDICHKVVNVEISDEEVPYESRPGVLSFEYLLPSNSQYFYIGPLTNINQPENSMRTTCSTIFSKSEFCAACHYGKFYDTVIYGSYEEWKKSPFGADPTSGTYRTCQDCHMPPINPSIVDSTSAQRQACSAENISFSNFNHNVMNFDTNVENFDTVDSIPRMVKDAAEIKPGFIYDPSEKNWFTVRVEVLSKGVGHRFPTDSPLRHLILVVEATDQRGVTLAHVNGERIPNWGGVGNPPPTPKVVNYGGLPGKIFANLLVEEDTNISPTAAYWNKTKYAWIGVLEEDPYDYSDTRLVPGRTDESRYSFAVPEDGDVTVTIKLIYRFAFIDLMWQKGWWDRPDILVTKVVCTGPAKEPLRWTCDPPLPPP